MIAPVRTAGSWTLAEDGSPTGIYFKVQKEANWLIEEFMLLANKRVAAYASRGGKYLKDMNMLFLKKTAIRLKIRITATLTIPT